MRDISFTAPSNSACSIVEGTHAQTLCIAATQTPTQPPHNRNTATKKRGKTHALHTHLLVHRPSPSRQLCSRPVLSLRRQRVLCRVNTEMRFNLWYRRHLLPASSVGHGTGALRGRGRHACVAEWLILLWAAAPRTTHHASQRTTTTTATTTTTSHPTCRIVSTKS